MEQHSGDFSVTVRDVRQLTQQERSADAAVGAEGSVNLAVAKVRRPLVADGWRLLTAATVAGSLRSAGANAVMSSPSASWLARLMMPLLSITR